MTRSNPIRSIRLAALALLGMFIAAAAFADDPLVYATIEPAQIHLGESAEYTITNLGDRRLRTPCRWFRD